MAFIAVSWDLEQKNLNVKIWTHVENLSKMNNNLSNLVADFKVPMKYIPAGEIKNLNEDISKININENSDILDESQKERHNNTTVPAEELKPENEVCLKTLSHTTKHEEDEEKFSEDNSPKDTEIEEEEKRCNNNEISVHQEENETQLQFNNTEKSNHIRKEMSKQYFESTLIQQPTMENSDNDTSADFKVFIHYLESKRLKTVSYKNNATKYERNCSMKNLISSENNLKRRLHEYVGRSIKKLPKLEMQKKRRFKEIQSITDQYEYENGIQFLDTNGNISSESNNRADRVSNCSDNDYTLLIDDDQPETDISPTKEDEDLKKLVNVSLQKKWKPVSTSSPRTEKRPFTCRSCKRSFNRECTYKKHVRFNHNFKFTCPICNVQFDYRSDFKKHFKTHCIVTKITEKNSKQHLACTKCNCKFDTPSKLMAHMKQHSDNLSPTYELNVQKKSPKK